MQMSFSRPRKTTKSRLISLSPGTTYTVASAPTEGTNVATTYTMRKKITMYGFSGVVRASFDLKVTSGTGYGKIYKNGVAVGTERTTTSTNYVTFTEDFSISHGDTIELWIKSSGANTWWQNLKIMTASNYVPVVNV